MSNESRSRRWDGKPETEADKRFFDNRESGYDGWLDDEGYRCDENGRRLADQGGLG